MTDSAYEVRDLRWEPGPGFRLAVDRLSIPAGRTTALLGPSASGKSSLLALLGRVEGGYFPEAEPPARAGRILFHLLPGVDGPVDLLAMDEAELMRRRIRGGVVGYVFQREGLFPGLDAAGNVAWPLAAGGLAPEEARARALQWLERVGLAPGREVDGLSGGERKRLAIARAMAPEPRVLLLDEPFTGLDPAALTALQDLLLEVIDGGARTVVLVSHQREDIERLAEHVVLLAAGRVAAAGSRDEVEDALGRFLAGDRANGGT
ncbi:MAG: ATP-binding cassette domain-containing protein [Myxococcota bacterium]